MGLRSIVVLLVLGITAGIVRSSVEGSPDAAVTLLLYTVAKTYEPLAWMHGSERFPAGARIVVSDARGDRALVADFAASADPAVSFDGQRALFAGKQKPGDHWQVFEVLLVAGVARRLTNCSDDCIRPLYLPDDRIVYARKRDGHFSVEVADLATAKPVALTYGPANFLPTDVLRDGRVLFEAGYPLGSDAQPEIYTVYPDGSGVESYRCDHGDAHHQGRQVSSGDIVFASKSGLSRFTSARSKELDLHPPAGQYAGDIAETAAGEWLLPWRSADKERFQIASWKPESGALRIVLADPDANVIQPVVLGEHPVPKRFPSGLHDWNNANLLCLNAYTSKYDFAAGAIRSVRFYSRDWGGNSRLLGTAPVESDGSFFVQVPTEQAIQVELLDGSGNTLKRETGYFWMRRGEQRVCVGCHAGPETAPENAVPMTLLKSTVPADMTGAQNAAGGH